MDRDLQNIGARIRRARKNKGMSQSRLSELLQISETHLSEIERGKTCGNMLLIKKMATILEVSADWLLLIDNENALLQSNDELSQLLSEFSPAQLEHTFKIVKQLKISFDALSNNANEN